MSATPHLFLQATVLYDTLFSVLDICPDFTLSSTECLTDNMLVPQTDTPSLIHSSFLPSISLDRSSHFSLALSGVLARLHGGDKALFSMATVRIYDDSIGWVELRYLCTT